MNRTSDPGVCAKDIVRPKRKGSMPSAFRHFQHSRKSAESRSFCGFVSLRERSVCECKAVERHAFQACPNGCERVARKRLPTKTRSAYRVAAGAAIPSQMPQ